MGTRLHQHGGRRTVFLDWLLYPSSSTFSVDEKSKYSISFHDMIDIFHIGGRILMFSDLREYSLYDNTGAVTANHAGAEVICAAIGGISNVFVSSVNSCTPVCSRICSLLLVYNSMVK